MTQTATPASQPPAPRRADPTRCAAPLFFAVLTLAMFYDVLFQNGNTILSSRAADITMQFLPDRDFGFSQMRQGRLPLWNPYVYGGTPYFAGFQSALLYPPNWLHLVLQPVAAINWGIALHVFTAGYFTYLWCRGRGASACGAAMGGVMFMFGGSYFLHIYAGHLTNLCVMVWAPLLLLSIEKLAQTGAMKWCLSGVAALAMAILAGHPQYVYYTGIVTLLYASLLMTRSKHRLALGGGYVAIFVGASLITAVQLLTGAEATGESVRSGRVSYEFASMFAFPPENLLTFFVPNIFGALTTYDNPGGEMEYFGRCHLWEMSVFVGVSGLAIAVYGLIAGWRRNILLIILATILVILAMGRHLPLYRPLYDYLPLYGSFRGVSKFIFFLPLILAALASTGFDALVAGEQKWWRLWTIIVVLGVAALLLAVLSGVISRSGPIGATGLWGRTLAWVANTGEAHLFAHYYSDLDFVRRTAISSAHSAGRGALMTAVVCLVFLVVRFRRHAAYGLLALAVLELFLFARGTRETMPGDLPYPDVWLSHAQAAPGDFRVVNFALPHEAHLVFISQGMSRGIQNLCGYDPTMLKRYAETIAVSQGYPADTASQQPSFTKGPKGMYQMLRCRFVFDMDNGVPVVFEVPSPLPVAQLVPGWVLRPTRDAALATVLDEAFDPRETVALESTPSITPDPTATGGPAEVVASSTDWVELRVRTDANNLLLVTNNYTRDWHVKALEPGPQPSYQIIPANYTLMAIPLAAGSHHIRIEYAPVAFEIGKWVSIVSLAAYVACLGAWTVRRRPSKPPP
ncbi:MAG: hypothetical protein K8S99_09390 [Planctomycetes bacterium]|nr:hypothetical protein [Planctomycetota bacterium]